MSVFLKVIIGQPLVPTERSNHKECCWKAQVHTPRSRSHDQSVRTNRKVLLLEILMSNIKDLALTVQKLLARFQFQTVNITDRASICLSLWLFTFSYSSKESLDQFLWGAVLIFFLPYSNIRNRISDIIHRIDDITYSNKWYHLSTR